MAEAPVEVAEVKPFPFPVPEGEFDKFTDLPWLSCTSCAACGACCKACWCPCLTMKDAIKESQFLESEMGQSGFWKKVDIWTAVFFILSIIGPSVGSLGGMIFGTTPMASYWQYFWSLSGYIFKFLTLWTMLKFRGYVAKQFNLDFCNGVGCCFDCCCVFWCWCWSLPQEFNTIMEKKPKEDEGIVGEAISAVKKLAGV